MILYNISFIMANHVVNYKPKVKGKDRKYSYAINKKWRYIIVAIISSIVKEKAVIRLILKHSFHKNSYQSVQIENVRGV